MRYTAKIKTGDVQYAGTDANGFLSLNGLDGVMREVELTDPTTVNDFERGDINSITIETAEDLGEIQTGTLREDRSGSGPGWYVDWVKIEHGEDGREWTAQVGAWSDHDGRNGRFPLLRFSRTSDGNYEQLESQKRLAARKKKERDDEKKATDNVAAADRQLDAEIARLEKEADLAEKRRRLEELRGKIGGTTAPTTGTVSVSRTFEVYGIRNGVNVPYLQAVTLANGRFQLLAGARLMIGDQPGDGWGYSGTPGRWSATFPGVSPTVYGLDADKGVISFDGAQAQAMSAAMLVQLFGPNWRAIVY